MVTKETVESLRAKGILGPSTPEDDPIYQQGWQIIMRPGIEKFIQKSSSAQTEKSKPPAHRRKPDRREPIESNAVAIS